jgi:hypothetical protein
LLLRNADWLLALSMIPTVLGAFGFMFAIERTKNSAAGVPVLLALLGLASGARPELTPVPDRRC